MPRRSFFLGMLAGLVLGALLMFANLSLFQANQPRPTAAGPRIVPVNVLTEVPAVPPQKKTPENWQEFEFNGRSVYVIPLGQREQLAAR